VSWAQQQDAGKRRFLLALRVHGIRQCWPWALTPEVTGAKTAQRDLRSVDQVVRQQLPLRAVADQGRGMCGAYMEPRHRVVTSQALRVPASRSACESATLAYHRGLRIAKSSRHCSVKLPPRAPRRSWHPIAPWALYRPGAAELSAHTDRYGYQISPICSEFPLLPNAGVQPQRLRSEATRTLESSYAKVDTGGQTHWASNSAGERYPNDECKR